MNSFIGWIGGKKLLRKEIIKRFPENMGRYIEVCGCAAWVLFAKERHAELEVYNDANGDLVNLFKCIKYHCMELQRELSFMLNSRELFEDFKTQFNTRGMTDIQRAARFFMLIKTSYGSDVRSYGCVKKDVSVILGEKRWTQADLSRRTGIRPTTISEIYNEIIERINIDHLDLICEALDCEVSDLIEYKPNKIRRTGKDLMK
ncbi:MAG: helix-turn-helix domain-containing protein [Clostridia bacterium]|nr:helix-turn-helix domain-containing protein [Clostridia bacterium]